MKIVIETIQHKEQRYDTIGDWQWILNDDPYTLRIKVSDTGDWKMNALIARHELDEALICLSNGISGKEVDEYDFKHPEAGSDCFSDNMDAPYFEAHNDALAFEWQMARI